MHETVIPFEPGDEYFFEEGCHVLEQLNHPTDPQVSIARARVPVATTTKWHRLIDVTERYYILEGTGLVEVGESLKQKVSTGDIVVIPPNCRQRIHNTGSVDLIFLAVCSPRFTVDCYFEC